MNTQNTDLHRYFQDLEKRWPSAFVARERIGEFSGGLLSAGRMANLDSQGLGPLERIRVGRKVCYPVRPLIEWMKERAEMLE